MLRPFHDWSVKDVPGTFHGRHHNKLTLEESYCASKVGVIRLVKLMVHVYFLQDWRRVGGCDHLRLVLRSVEEAVSMMKPRAFSRDSWPMVDDCSLGDDLDQFRCERFDERRVGKALWR